MPIGAITMILTNVGLQVYNNWCSNRQNQKLAELRDEYRLAAEERRLERMMQLMRDGQKITLELEAKQHENRILDQNSNIDQLLQQLTHETAISKWPMKVLPIIMQSRSLGNLIINKEEKTALHCIFTPSNNFKFNKYVFPLIENALEQYANKYWGTMSDHPVLFYSGAWKTSNGIIAEAPTAVQIQSMRKNLRNLPTLMISPYFHPTKKYLLFQVQMWGVGAASSDEFSIPEIIPQKSDFRFQHDYTSETSYDNNEIINWIVEDLVPYLQCMIGYMADTYFWSGFGLAPQLPYLLTSGRINTDGMRYLLEDSKDYYGKLFLESEKASSRMPFHQDNILSLYESCAELWDDSTKEDKLKSLFISYCAKKTGKEVSSVDEAIKHFSLIKHGNDDIIFLLEVSKRLDDDMREKNAIDDLISNLVSSEQSFVACFTASSKELQLKIKENNIYSQEYFVFKVLSSNTIIGIFTNKLHDLKAVSFNLFFCYESIGVSSGVYVSSTESFKAKKYPETIFPIVYFEGADFNNMYQLQLSEFDRYIKLYDELDSKTDISTLRWQYDLYQTQEDIKKWVSENFKNGYSGIAFFKGFSTKYKKYLLLGVFRKNDVLQLGERILVSFYDSFPPNINEAFKNNTQYSLNFN